jgi:hypothetical protein
VAALSSHGLARWVPYYLFRSTGGTWQNDATGPARLLFFLLLLGLNGAAFGWQAVGTPTTLAIVAWFVFKARHELRDIARGTRLIHGDAVPAGSVDEATPAQSGLTETLREATREITPPESRGAK